jgi:predicted ribosomally synthesized peptide with SipW-like signal peptide
MYKQGNGRRMLKKLFDRIGPAGSALRKVAGVAISILMLAAFATGASWSYLSDSETSSGNSVQAGSLDLVPLVSGSYTGGSAFLYVVTPGGNGINGNVSFYKLAPGQNGNIEWTLSNTGSLPGTLTVSITGTFTDGVAAVEPESFFNGTNGLPSNNGGGNGDLDEYVMVTLQKGAGASQSAAEAALASGYINPGHNNTDSTPFALGEMAALWNGDSTSMSAAGGSACYVVYRFNWSLSDTDPNISITQGDTAQLDITFTLSQ